MLCFGSGKGGWAGALGAGLGMAALCAGAFGLAPRSSDRTRGGPVGDEVEHLPDRHAELHTQDEEVPSWVGGAGTEVGHLGLTGGVRADFLRAGGAGPDEFGSSMGGVVGRQAPMDGSPRGRGGGGGAGSGYGRGTAPREDPGGKGRRITRGVLASTFVGGQGATARLNDLLDRGVVVGGENVRLEAFEDRAPLPHPVPAKEAVAMYAELERARVHASGDVVHLQIALVAKQGEAPPRPRMDVRLVLDRSGSMQGEKWTRAVAAAHALVDRLRPSDAFGLVSYSESPTLDLPARTLGNRAEAHRAIDALEPGGSTDIGAALALVAGHAPRRRSSTDVALVVLVSDGQVTVGERSPQVLGGFAREMFDRGGVLTTTVGLGADFDEQTMLGIAREGSGSYHFVRRPADVESVLTDELEERVQAVAQALRVRVVLGPGVAARKVYGSRLLSDAERRAVRGTEAATDARLARELGIVRDREEDPDEGLRVHLPTFRRGDQHVILMELEVPGGRARGSAGVATVTLDYKDLGLGRNATKSAPVTAERSSDREAVAASTRRLVKRTVLAFQAGEALQDAAAALVRGDAPFARGLLAERIALLRTAADLWRDESLARDASLLERYERVVASAYPTWGSDERRTLEMAMGYFGDRRMR